MAEATTFPRLIFTVTTGRSGTGYLAQVLSCFSGVQAAHEPTPRFHKWMRQALADPKAASDFWREHKLPAIAGCRRPVYAETSHLFCKGFFEPLLELSRIPDIILLRRVHRQVAASLYGLNTIPGRTELGRTYYLSPEDPVLLPLPDWQRLHDYQVCYWYCLETERRQQQYGKRIRALGGRVADLPLEQLSSAEGIGQLSQALELQPPGLVGRFRLHRLLGQKVNTKTRRKQQSLETTEMEQLEAELLELLQAGTR